MPTKTVALEKKTTGPVNVASNLDLRFEEYWGHIRASGQRYPDFDWPSLELMLKFIYTFDVISKHFTKQIKKTGLSPAGFNVLVILSRVEDKGCKQREISKLLLVSRANVTGLINHLVRMGLVERGADANDSRVWIIRITQKGKTLLHSYLPEHYREIKRVCACLNGEHKRIFCGLLTKLRENTQ